jgi:hypothetical protein
VDAMTGTELSAEELLNAPDVPARDYHYWSDQELWELYCWWEAKQRIGNMTGKALELGTTSSNLGGVVKRARAEIERIEGRLGKTYRDRERQIRKCVS